MTDPVLKYYSVSYSPPCQKQSDACKAERATLPDIVEAPDFISAVSMLRGLNIEYWEVIGLVLRPNGVQKIPSILRPT